MNNENNPPIWMWAVIARMVSMFWIAPLVYQVERIPQTNGYEQLGHVTLLIILAVLVIALWMVGVDFRD